MSITDSTSVSADTPVKTKPFRAVVVGLGAGAEQIMLPAATNQPNVQLVAACDLDTTIRKKAATR